jgi:hypothetical protein
VLQQAAHAQATTASGAIQGTISDPQGAILPRAQITVTSLATGAKKILTADSSGFYSVASLIPGQYQVSVTAPGFAKTTTTLTVQIGITSNGDMKMKVGSATETVMVSTEMLQVNTIQSTVEGVLTAQQIDTLPISGRNFLDLSQLEPGVQLQSGETFDPTKAGYSSISFNGVNGRTARILLDGQDISDETVGTTTLNVSQGSIEEFNISRSSLDISNELTSSGAVAVSTRAGTNKFHGQGFGLFRDERTGAAAMPGGSNLPFQRNQMGGRLGGPVLKDKLFLFGSAERVKQDSNNFYAVLDPFSAYSGSYTTPFRDNYYVSRMDYNAPKGVHMFARIAYEDNLNDATFGYGFSRYGNKDNTPAIAGGADFLTGKFTHSLRGSYLKFHNQIADESAGLENLTPGGEFFIENLITGPNLLAPQQTYQSDKQFRYDGSVTYKTHTINFGVSTNRILNGGYASFFGFGPQISADFGDGPLGGAKQASNPLDYSLSGVTMGNGLGSSTEIPEFGFGGGGQMSWRMGLYIGDTWKVSSKLTINYGLRYSRDTGRSDADMAPIPCSAAVTLIGTASPCTTGNLLDALETGLGNSVRQPNLNFGPKAGFAYSLKGNGKTVIRGGLGLYYENNIFNNMLWDRPAKLAKGLFLTYPPVNTGTTSWAQPDGTVVSSFPYQAPSTACTSTGNTVAPLGPGGTMLLSQVFDSFASGTAMPICQAAPYIVELSKSYQSATAKVGAGANSGYVAQTLSVGGNNQHSGSYILYAPNYQTPRSIQINVGIQHEFWRGGIFTADYIRNIGEHFMVLIDKNHVGDASTLELKAAQKAISNTLAYCNVTTIDAAIAQCSPSASGGNPPPTPFPATMSTFASFGLDSGNGPFLSSGPAALGANTPLGSLTGLTADTGAAFPGINPSFGSMYYNYPGGKSLYNGLQLNMRQSTRVPLPGLKASNFEVSYALSRFVSSGGTDQNFTPNPVDWKNPLGYIGPAGTDRTHMLSYGGTFKWAGGITTDFIGHYFSALPTTLFLDNQGNTTGEIYMSDITGDGTIRDILPGYKNGAFMRSIKPKDLSGVIANYNLAGAHKLTPAGQALVSNGLMTSAEMTELGAVTRSIAAPPTNNAGNGNMRTFDLTLGRPSKLPWLGGGISVEPTISAFNLFNFSNFGAYGVVGGTGGNLYSSQEPGTPNGTDTSLGSPYNRTAMRNGNGSGVFGQGVARVIEYGLKFNF